MKTQILVLALMAGSVMQAAPAVAQDRGAMPTFETLDTDGDGVITQSDIDAAAAARFAEADTNGDGALSVEELAAAREMRQSERQDARMTRLLERLDTNEDGQLQPEELAEARGDRGGRMFDRVDTDDDGTITAEEFADARDRMKDRGGRHDRGGHGPKRGR